MPAHQLRRALALALVALAPLACARPVPVDGAPPAGGEAEEAADLPAIVRFENRTLDQVALYLVPRGGLQRRLGTVQAGRTEQFTLPRDMWGAGASVIFVARAIGGGAAPRTDQLSITPGLRLLVTLPPQGNQLTVLPDH